MQWLVRNGESSLIVRLPEPLPNGMPFAATLGGEPVTVALREADGVLIVSDEHGVERLVKIRSRRLERGDNGETKVLLELRSPLGVASAELSVEPHVPGQSARGRAKAGQGLVVRSQITGKVLTVFVATGDSVEAGQPLAIIEAMKMENRVFAARGGIVQAVQVKPGDSVATGKELFRLAEKEA